MRTALGFDPSFCTKMSRIACPRNPIETPLTPFSKVLDPPLLNESPSQNWRVCNGCVPEFAYNNNNHGWTLSLKCQTLNRLGKYCHVDCCTYSFVALLCQRVYADYTLPHVLYVVLHFGIRRVVPFLYNGDFGNISTGESLFGHLPVVGVIKDLVSLGLVPYRQT